ncbi:MAG: SpaA isopeptide-forming pilin-related protein [Candidatus Saccharibacteria bacterium]|nr:SpaA isopeptide-forming pilin-related protein [Candidatus Saccharibacteria bacterium]
MASLNYLKPVKAASLNMIDTGYWYNLTLPESSKTLSWYYRAYELGGETAYCIEPNTIEGTDNYRLGDWDVTNIPGAIRERIALIGYYGYTYPGHQTLAYRAATQGLIWDTILGKEANTTFWTGRYQSGSQLSITNEQAEIENLINHHFDTPSFASGEYSIQVGENLILTDENNVLSEYEISATGATYSVNGNELTIKLEELGRAEFTLTKKTPYRDRYKIFVGEGIQDMFVPGIISPITAQIKVESYYGRITITKVDSETGKTPQGLATLKGAVYGLYDKAGNLIDALVTDEDGIGQSNLDLKYGEYYLKEISPSEGYYLDDTTYYLGEFKKETLVVEVPEEVIKNKIQILKQYEQLVAETGMLTPEEGVIFEVYAQNGDKIGEIITNEDGYSEIILPYGIWTFHQVNSKAGYEKVEDFLVVVDSDSPLVQLYELLDEPSTPKIDAKDDISATDSSITPQDPDLAEPGRGLVAETETVAEATAVVSEKQISVITVPNTSANDYYVIETVGVLFIVGGIGIFIHDRKER